ncbi:hypothetical protein GCM10027203_63770 [Nonomuraea fastidiosa]
MDGAADAAVASTVTIPLPATSAAARAVASLLFLRTVNSLSRYGMGHRAARPVFGAAWGAAWQALTDLR